MEILPGIPGVDEYSKVRYRRMSTPEKADWRRRIEAAKKASGGRTR